MSEIPNNHLSLPCSAIYNQVDFQAGLYDLQYHRANHQLAYLGIQLLSAIQLQPPHPGNL